MAGCPTEGGGAAAFASPAEAPFVSAPATAVAQELHLLGVGLEDVRQALERTLRVNQHDERESGRWTRRTVAISSE